MSISNADIRPTMRMVMRGALRGKTIGRILFNEIVRMRSGRLEGRVLDLAGGPDASYVKLLPADIEIVRTNRASSEGVREVDFNKPLPFPDDFFDSVLLFNAIYIAEDPDALLREISRVLKRGGTLLLSSPFVGNEMPEPHDYRRYTAEGLARLCDTVGFASCSIERIGERATAAAVLMHPFLLANWIRAFVFPLALFLDRSIPAHIRTEHPNPMFYFVTATK